MPVVQARIDAGVCGFVTEVSAECDDGQNVKFVIASPCENIQALVGRLVEVDVYSEIMTGFDGQIHTAARASLKGCCSGCVVPVGIFKAMQVAAGLALPRPASLTLDTSGN
ncbi:MAG: hypothetical protein GYA63_02765 [Armatimonadetes bacterium]|jgi:hypothetical protein|nr:hypothetical protein [Armatimonadota bacterium]HOC31973.1 hypothetical protein [Armatimonadota bacterium]